MPEGRRWLETFLGSEPDGSAERLQGLVALGDLAERQGDYAAATTWTEDALALARTLGDRGAEAAALRGLGNAAMARGEVASHGRGDAALADAEFARAQTCLEQSIALARELADAWGAAKAAHWLAIAIGVRGDRLGAIAYFEDAIAAFRRLGDQRQLCLVLWNLGGATRELGDLPRARAAFAESLVLAQRLGYRWHGGLCLVGLAFVALDSGEDERAAWLLGAAEALREATGEPLRPVVQAQHDQAAAAARAALGEAGFAAAWAAGGALPPEEVVAMATAVGAPGPDRPEFRAEALTAREREVLRLVAAGRTDREIAKELFLSRRTVNTHVANIRTKLDAPTRREAVARAREQGWLSMADEPPRYT